MGRAATERSDVVILTSDNPRTEDPMAILQEVEAGVRDVLEAGRVRYEMIPDRRAAIETAIREAKRGDMVLIAGKGHENYQIIGKQKFRFDDREVAREAVLLWQLQRLSLRKRNADAAYIPHASTAGRQLPGSH